MTVTICALMWSQPGCDGLLHAGLTDSLRTAAKFGGLPIARYRRKDGAIGPLEILTIRWPSLEVLNRFRIEMNASQAMAAESSLLGNLVIGYEESLRPARREPVLDPGSSVTVCALVWSRPGQELLLTAYASRALANAESFGGHILQRLRRLPGSSGPQETQVLEFPSEEALAAYREAQRVDEYSRIRATAIADCLVIRVESMLESAMPSRQ